jgi:hypothetical protein
MFRFLTPHSLRNASLILTFLALPLLDCGAVFRTTWESILRGVQKATSMLCAAFSECS